MNRRLPLAILLALIAIVLAVCSVDAQSLQYQHGHLINIPVVFDSDGLPIWSTTHAFLAVKLETVPPKSACIDYTQTVDYLDLGSGAVVRAGATISRCVLTSQAGEDGWLILPLSKPCGPDEATTNVGYVTVCPPRLDGGTVDGCTSPAAGITPLFAGVPPERVACGLARKRRSAR